MHPSQLLLTHLHFFPNNQPFMPGAEPGEEREQDKLGLFPHGASVQLGDPIQAGYTRYCLSEVRALRETNSC